MGIPEAHVTAVEVRVYGRVQGVMYRAWTVRTATELGLSGWVRNRRDGSVEALFVGVSANIEIMIGQCRRGPPAARVDELIREIPANIELSTVQAAGFRQLPSV